MSQQYLYSCQSGIKPQSKIAKTCPYVECNKGRFFWDRQGRLRLCVVHQKLQSTNGRPPTFCLSQSLIAAARTPSGPLGRPGASSSSSLLLLYPPCPPERRSYPPGSMERCWKSLQWLAFSLNAPPQLCKKPGKVDFHLSDDRFRIGLPCCVPRYCPNGRSRRTGILPEKVIEANPFSVTPSTSGVFP